jgi:hypothetical protein
MILGGILRIQPQDNGTFCADCFIRVVTGGGFMKCYTVAPNRDANGWYVKLEDTAPFGEHAKKDDAIQAGLELAKANSPSRLVILDEKHEVEDEQVFKQ